MGNETAFVFPRRTTSRERICTARGVGSGSCRDRTAILCGSQGGARLQCETGPCGLRVARPGGEREAVDEAAAGSLFGNVPVEDLRRPSQSRRFENREVADAPRRARAVVRIAALD